jgi:chemotaxis-related protein WspD
MADAVGATYNRLLVVGWHGQRQAFPVDEIAGTHRFHPQEINETPTFEAGSTYTRGRLNWEGRAVDVLNEEMLFNTLNVSLA